MKPMEEMMQAVRDWVNGKTKPLLKQTGDASKVTTIFTKNSTRTLPASGEELDITLGKILKYLSDLSDGMAFTKDADKLTWKQIVRCYHLFHSAPAAAFEESISDILIGTEITGTNASNPKYLYLLYGIGGAVNSSSEIQSEADFFRVYFIAGLTGGALKIIQAASVGSTARFTVATKLPLTIKIPKGSYANVRIMKLPFSENYV